jgi:hypothetical protein
MTGKHGGPLCVSGESGGGIAGWEEKRPRRCPGIHLPVCAVAGKIFERNDEDD